MIGILLFLMVLFVMTSAGVRLLGIKNHLFQPGEIIIYGSALGLFLLSLSVLVLGLLGHLTPITLIASFSIWFIVGYRNFYKLEELWRVFASQISFRKNYFNFFILTCILFSALAVIVGILAPETANDSLCYHLHVPKIFLQLGRIQRIPCEINSLFPFFMEMLDSYGIAWHQISLAKCFHAFTAILAAGSIFLAGKKVVPHSSKIAAGFASMLFITTPGIVNQMGTTYVDISLAGFTGLAFYAYLQWSDSRRSFWAILSGVMLGISLSIKFLALISFFAIFILMVLDSIKKSSESNLRSLLWFIGTAFLGCSYWYLRAWMELGNPVYPYFYQIFKAGVPNIHYDDIGTTKTLWNFIRMPWLMSIKPQIFEGFGDNIGPSYLALVPIGVLAGFKNPVLKRAGFFSLFYLVMWFFLGQSLRFFFPALPILALFMVEAIDFLLRTKSRLFIGLFKLCFSLLIFIHTGLAIYHYRGAVRVSFGLETGEAYLTRVERSYAISQFVNRHLPPDAKILNAVEVRMFYFDRTMVREDMYAHDTSYQSKAKSAQEVLNLLKQDGFTHILLTTGPGIEWNNLPALRIPSILLNPEKSLATLKTPLYTYTFTGPGQPSVTYSLYEI